jgi:hypothetical protein
MRRTFVCALALVICTCLVLPSHAFFNSEVRKAKKFMAAQMYQDAVGLLQKRIKDKPTDEEAHFLLAECSLHIGDYGTASQRFNSAVALEPELKSQIVPICLKAADGKKNVNDSALILFMAEKYATTGDQQAIGERLLALSQKSTGKQQKNLMKRASRYLGHGEVFGFEVEPIGNGLYKVSFFTDEPIKILEWKKGGTITFTESSNPDGILIKKKVKNEFAAIPMNFPLTETVSSFPLIIRGKKNHWFTMKTDLAFE